MDQKTAAYLFCAIILLCVSFDGCQCDEQTAASFGSQESGSHKKNSTGSRYCGNSLVRAMRLICDGYYAEPSLKRSLDYPYENDQPKRRINRKYKIWKRQFNLKDSDLTTWPELDRQYQLLFGSEVHQNNRLSPVGQFTPFRPTASEESASGANRTLRRNKRGIYEECCRQPCTVGYMKTYCLQT